MRIIEAHWDKHNFGKNVYEVILSATDLENIDKVIEDLENEDFSASYVSIKMPVGNLQALHRLQEYGFMFMEAQFTISRKLKGYETPRAFKNLMEDVDIIDVYGDKELWFSVIDAIEPGMFETDRVYLDPSLGKDVAHKRYQNWLRDLFYDNSAHMWLARDKKNQQFIAFGSYKINERNTTASGILGGVFNSYKEAAFGGLFIDAPLHILKNKNLRTLRTFISSNNINVISLYSYFGFTFEAETYVLRKQFLDRSEKTVSAN